MNNFFAEVCRNPHFLAIIHGGKITDLAFTTSLKGGFGSASFKFPMTRTKASVLSTQILGKSTAIYDQFGDRIFTGVADEVTTTNEGLDVELSGFYFTGKYQKLQLEYANDETVLDIMEDVINSNKYYWYFDQGQFETASPVVATADEPRDYFNTDLISVIEDLLKYGAGSNATNAAYTYFAVWDKLVEFLRIPRSNPNQYADWYANFESIENYTVTRSMDNVYNKIRAVYTTTEGIETFTNWYYDYASVGKFNEREGVINAGDTEQGTGELVAQLALKHVSDPGYQSTFGLTSYVKDRLNRITPLYKIRAGDTIHVADLDMSLFATNSLAGSANGAVFTVNETSFNGDNDTMSIEVGVVSTDLSLYLSLLGVGDSGVE